MDATQTEVLTIDNAAAVGNRARLHAPTCKALNRFRGRRTGLYVVEEDVAASVADLIEMGYPVPRCKCLK